MKSARFIFLSRPAPAILAGIIKIYKHEGWWDSASGAADCKALIKGSHCFAAACCGGKVIGMARAISDGASDAYIQDVAVLPEHRGRGVASALVRKIISRLKRDGINWIGLIASGGSGPLYAKSGFKKMLQAQPMLLK